MQKTNMQWVRAVGGVVLVFVGVHQVVHGTANALQEQMVALFWRNHRKLQQQGRI